MTDPKNIAICLSFLMEGFNAQHENKFGYSSKFEQYEYHNNIHGGHIGITADFYSFAVLIENYLEARYPTQDFPGVFHYEVTETLGKWLFTESPYLRDDEFAAHAITVIDAWFADGLAAHADSVGSLAHGFPVSAPTDTPTLNATQPAVATKESTTMKINDLIVLLENAQDAHGNVDVVIRGSKPTSFVDATEARLIKTPKRHAVYIGKAPATQPQE